MRRTIHALLGWNAGCGLGLLLILSGCVGSRLLPGSSIGDNCVWLATASAWRDDNGDGERQMDEPALANVQITVEGLPSTQNVWMTDQRGLAEMRVQLWPCSAASLLIRATPPPGYRATAPTEVPVQYDPQQGRTTVHGQPLNQQASRDPVPLGFSFVKE